MTNDEVRKVIIKLMERCTFTMYEIGKAEVHASRSENDEDVMECDELFQKYKTCYYFLAEALCQDYFINIISDELTNDMLRDGYTIKKNTNLLKTNLL